MDSIRLTDAFAAAQRLHRYFLCFCLFALAVTFLASRFVVRTETHTLSKLVKKKNKFFFLRQPPELYPRSLFIINLPALISDAPQVCALCFAYSVCDGKLARPRGGGEGMKSVSICVAVTFVYER